MNEKENDIIILTFEEAKKHIKGQRYEQDMMRLLAGHIPFSRAEMYADYIIGECLVDEGTIDNPKQTYVVYCLSKKEIVFVTGQESKQLLSDIVLQTEWERESGAVLFFLRFLEQTLQDDTEYLQIIEESCYDMEEHILSGKCENNPANTMLYFRKHLLVRCFHYQQMTDMCETLETNMNDIFSEKELVLLAGFRNKADRLYQHCQMLREYMVQIRELYQQQIDIQQNSTMKVLTIVTAVFAPLSLIAGWFGMNFENMPEIHSSYGYPGVIILCMLVVVIEIAYFKYKRFW